MGDLQTAMEEGIGRALGQEDARMVLCHRGSLDPLAYWLDRGWPEEEFFAYTRSRRADHFRRYAAVLHLVTTADGAEESYRRWPKVHRPETIEYAIRLDELLRQVWGGHPHYHRIDNDGKDWPAKSRRAKEILEGLFQN